MRGQWDIALRDLDYAIGLDATATARSPGASCARASAEIAAYALARLSIALDGASLPPRVTEHLVDHHSDGAYAVLRFEAACAAAAAPC